MRNARTKQASAELSPLHSLCAQDQEPPPIDERRFRQLPATQRSSKVRAMSARLYVGKFVEHRDAAEFIDSSVKVHGAGIDTIVRALLLYKEYLELKEGLDNDSPMDEHGQLILAAASAGPSARGAA